MSNERDYQELEALARRGRWLAISTVAGSGAGHVGGPFSAMDILIALYFQVMNIKPEEPRWPERDRFILSKGHSSIGHYTVMALAGLSSRSKSSRPSTRAAHDCRAILMSRNFRAWILRPVRSVRACRSVWASPWAPECESRSFTPSSCWATANCRKGWSGKLCTSPRDTSWVI